MTKEACVENIHQAILAEKKGADQIELCTRLDLDGNSPPLPLIEHVIKKVSIPVKVIVNPIPYQYCYNEDEISLILNYINTISHLPIAGIVFGPLTKENLPDIEALKLVKATTPLPITFHKAIDQTNIKISLELLKRTNLIDAVLSSGGAPSALAGIDELRAMKAILYQSPIKLIAAGSITNENITSLHSLLQLKYYHGRKIVGSL